MIVRKRAMMRDPQIFQRPSRRGGMHGLRELTVTTLHRVSSRHGGREQAVPYLRISGRWLEQYGLMRGCRVVVSGEPGKLVLTVAAAVGPVCA
ncbi:MAG TPA: SymE family type I addiction module toxin [Thermoanaerobaculia bacterium]|nr:SymE family type I addiction module toxin [Thermoanaerobaculia bacterium]